MEMMIIVESSLPKTVASTGNCARGVRIRTASLLRLDGSLDSMETGRMPLGWKLLIDSTNAPTLADFWAAALEYEVEDPSALISQLLAAGHIGSEAVVEYRGRRIFRG